MDAEVSQIVEAEELVGPVYEPWKIGVISHLDLIFGCVVMQQIGDNLSGLKLGS